MEDVDLTPQLYHSPIALRGKEVTANVGKALFQDVHSYFQIINIETDEDFLGFEVFNQVKREKYIKYEQSIILSSLKPDIFVSGDSIVDVSIALSEQELTQKRTYPKLIEVLGDVGGLMEVLFSLFRIISSFLNNTLYEKSLVNHLFSFNLEQKVLLIKENKKKKIFKMLKENSPKIYLKESTENKFPDHIEIFGNGDIPINARNKLIEDSSKTKFSNDNIFNKSKKKKKIKIKKKSKITEKIYDYNTDEKNNVNEKDYDMNMQLSGKDSSGVNTNHLDNLEKKEAASKKCTEYIDTQSGKVMQQEKEHIIHKIKFNKCLICCCLFCVRKRKNIQNVLLDEGMKVITERLDIMNMFKKLYISEKDLEKEKIFANLIDMSDVCKANIMGLKY
jgi:hypothetical protein